MLPGNTQEDGHQVQTLLPVSQKIPNKVGDSYIEMETSIMVTLPLFREKHGRA
jgi:hypothetical protein